MMKRNLYATVEYFHCAHIDEIQFFVTVWPQGTSGVKEQPDASYVEKYRDKTQRHVDERQCYHDVICLEEDTTIFWEQ